MAIEKTYIGSVGLSIEVDMGENIVGATDLKFRVRKPDGKEITWTPFIFGTTELRYVTVNGDLDLAGTYLVQPELSLGSWSGLGKTVSFDVSKRFD